MVRLFIAIDLPEDIREEITDLYRAIPGTRWLVDEQIHLTLKFIGETTPQTEDRIISVLKQVSVPPFSLSLKGVGYFPPRKSPRVLWIGVSENEYLLRLQNQIERALDSIQIKPESRKFYPHITIARLSDPHREKIAQFITDNSLFSTKSFDVSEFYLYRSILGKDGAHYQKEASFSLSE